MNFSQSLQYLNRLVNYERFTGYDYGRAYDLGRVTRLLSLLGEPQKKYPCIAVSGTKGKGSTVCMLASIFNEAGIRTGMYISPHLVRVQERISINNRCIGKAEFADIISRIKNISDKNGIRGITYFEALTAACFLYFAFKHVCAGVFEVGLGGRLDAVNAAKPSIAGIMPISYDHTKLLGASLDKIAFEKCGIIHDDSFVACAFQKKKAFDIIRQQALKKNAKLLSIRNDIKVKNVKASLTGTDFILKTPHAYYKKIHTSLMGRHQAENAAVAAAIAERAREAFGFRISKKNIIQGLRKAVFPGRFEICSESPYVVLDGAQNEASSFALKKALLDVFGKRPILLILGVSSDKDYKKILKNLCPLAGNIIFTQAETVRALSAAELANQAEGLGIRGYACRNIVDAFIFAKALVPKDGIIVITGSLFLVGDFKRYFIKET